MALRTKENTTKTRTVPPHFYQKVTLRIKKATAKKASSGNPMLVFELEICDPLEVTLDGIKYNLDGIPLVKYQVITSPKQDNAALLGEFREKLGLPYEFDDDVNTMNVQEYEGIVFDTMLGSKEDIAQNRTGTGPDGKGIYEPVLDENNKPLSQGWDFLFNLENVIGLSTIKMNVAY